MTERKPPGVSFESWIDRQIREAEARGEFAELPGAGKPMPAITDTSYDELWWIKRKMAREGLSVLPPTLALRKEAEDALAAAAAAPSERVVRRIIEDINTKIREVMFKPPPGPPLGLKPYDVEEIVREWRERREGPADPPMTTEAAPRDMVRGAASVITAVTAAGGGSAGWVLSPRPGGDLLARPAFEDERVSAMRGSGGGSPQVRDG